MKRVTLFRHAKSSWDDEQVSDRDRPLAARGRRDAPRMGKRLAQRGFAPTLLLTSPAVRARQTAELIAPALGDAKLETRIEPGIYLASPGQLLAVLAGIEDDIDELVLVGHNPGLTELANRLLPELALDNLPTAGAIAIDCAANGWRRIESAPLTLRFYDYPKNAAVME